MSKPENTVIVNYAGGYSTYRMNIAGMGIVKLEHSDATYDNPSEENWKTIRTFRDTTDAWVYIGQQLGWIPNEVTHDTYVEDHTTVI